jgi:hypothetical protein
VAVLGKKLLLNEVILERLPRLFCLSAKAKFLKEVGQTEPPPDADVLSIRLSWPMSLLAVLG